MDRKSVLTNVFIIILSFGQLTHGRRSRPNIVMIIADDMGWNDVSYHGSDQIPTPNIDALAYNGVILGRHYVMPVCTPSRVSLYTGRYAVREGLQGYPLAPGDPRGIDPGVTLLPAHLRQLGYSTHLIGKWHVGYAKPSLTPTHRGFDSFLGYYNGVISYYNHTLRRSVYDESTPYGRDYHRDDTEFLRPENVSGYATDLFTEEAVRIIEQRDCRDAEKPLFLVLSHLAVHSSQEADPLEVRNQTQVDESFGHIKDPKRRKYAGMMQAMDESVGRVVEAMSRANMLENSIIIFMADNGAPTIGLYENSGSNYPFRGIKGTTYEGGIRGTACIFSPLITSRMRVSHELMHMTDWLPTLYEAAGGNVEDLSSANHTLDGVSQWSAIKNGSRSPRKSLLVNINELTGEEAAIVGRYKLVKGVAELDGFYGKQPVAIAQNNLIDEALASPTGDAIRRIRGFIGATAAQAEDVRHNSKVVCSSSNEDDAASMASFTKCMSNACLFDLHNDPCETKDLAGEKPEVLQRLADYIDEHRNIIKPQRAKRYADPCADPEYHDGYWMPWRQNDDGDGIAKDDHCGLLRAASTLAVRS